MDRNIPKEQLLRKFSRARRVEKIGSEKEAKYFEEFQRFNLIRAGSAGKFRITKQGEHALVVGIRQYLSNVRLEKRLFKEYMRSKMQYRWLLFVVVLLLLFALSFFTYFML